MNGQQRPVRHPAIETAGFGTEAVLYDERTGTVHHLNASAYAVWELLDGRPIDDVIVTLSQMTDLPPGHIERDVALTLVEFRDAGLLTDGGGAPS